MPHSILPTYSALFGETVRRLGLCIGGLALGIALSAPEAGHAQGATSNEGDPVIVDNFEDDAPGTFPDGWVFVKSDENIQSYEESRDPGETVEVREEDGNRYVRLITDGEALRYTKRNGVDFEWNLKDHPRLKWRWRARKLPEGASERDQNDTGGAVYVTFGSDWLGRPKSIKYTYSSSLPVGTTVSFGPLKVIVVDSAREPRTGEWETVQRRIRDDYRQVFGEDPPDRPVSITLWSDSDTTGDEAKVDVDDIELLPPR
ncbi:hypothetical protein GGQ19_000115 [Salinibacter ruber]|uniref:DUF3047 domain-containing protein n=1 Tax=Salinibacter ruber TaxID=146919 RepID=UPI00216A50C5|nr:DUF3047 domain-containing protein [Salinibacter ruber]MCS3748964.1 hypothetical protein [Salinibacter ruber]MCS3753511.1 hypothetical protein [Salinibacter ruber]